LEVFDRPETFDPTVDPLVRIEAARLREKLANITEPKAKAIPFTSTYRRAHTHRKSSSARGCTPNCSRRAPPTQEVSSTVPALAVLPFDDLSADQNLGYLGDGVAEDIITALSRFPDLAVVARGSSFAYKDKASICGGSEKNLASATWSKAAYARTATRFESCPS